MRSNPVMIPAMRSWCRVTKRPIARPPGRCVVVNTSCRKLAWSVSRTQEWRYTRHFARRSRNHRAGPTPSRFLPRVFDIATIWLRLRRAGIFVVFRVFVISRRDKPSTRQWPAPRLEAEGHEEQPERKGNRGQGDRSAQAAEIGDASADQKHHRTPDESAGRADKRNSAGTAFRRVLLGYPQRIHCEVRAADTEKEYQHEEPRQRVRRHIKHVPECDGHADAPRGRVAPYRQPPR